MTYKIPPEEEVVKAIENCMARMPHMRSQTELCNAVGAELSFIDGEYRIGAERVRRIGIANGLFTVDIRYARTDRPPRSVTCPVCGGALDTVRNMTLDGGAVDLKRKCHLCGYSASGESVRPSRYTVNRRIQTEAEGRIGKLRRAQGLMLEAASLIDDAMHMSGMEPRTGRMSDSLRAMAGDQKDGGSIANVIRDLEYMSEEQPCWTQPLVSPKYHPDQKGN